MRGHRIVGVAAAVLCGCTQGSPTETAAFQGTGFWHLPDPSTAQTMALDSDGGVRFWHEQCDSIGLSSAGPWLALSEDRAQIPGAEGHPTLTLVDGGLLRIEPPLTTGVGAPAELWARGAVCSVCLPGQTPAVVRCTSPDAGVPGSCCAGACNGDVPVAPLCTPTALGEAEGGVAEGRGDREPALVPAGQCVCPAGSVSAAECADAPFVFCGGDQPGTLAWPDAGAP